MTAFPRRRPSSGQQVTVIRPPSRWPGVDVAELLAFRELAFRLAQRDVTLRYRQTLLGVVWVFLQPLLSAGAFSFVFGRVAGLPAPDGLPYFLLAYWGSTAFTVFSSCVTRSAGSLVGNSALVSKVYFPRLLLPISTTGATALDAAVAAATGIVLGVLYDVELGLALLTLPLWMVGGLVLGLGLGTLCAPLVLRFRDVAYVLPVLLQVLLYVSPVAYALDAVPVRLQALYQLNPLTSLIEGTRWAVLGTPAPGPSALAVTALALVVALAAGLVGFRRQERLFADVV